MKKRIIACCDGAWNKPGNIDRGKRVQTNVEIIFNAICKNGDGIEQVKLYDSGVGTGYSIKDRFIGGAAGLGIDEKIKDVYKFLILNYESEDQEIYLFGFSRGAYTARSVVGLINNCGILKPEYFHLVNEAYNLYRNRNSYSAPDSDLMMAFKNRYCHQPRIKFLGVWDTVGSLGLPLPSFLKLNSKKFEFHDVTLSSIVDYAYHALAIHERRPMFQPALWKQIESVKQSKQVLEQRWFAGVHSNIGGGYCDTGLSDIALQWLIKKSSECGLCFHDDKVGQIKPDYNGEMRNSYTALYWFWLPKWRKIYDDKDRKEVLDISVLERYKHKTMPKNVKKALKEKIDVN